jgi:hypothetical protein
MIRVTVGGVTTATILCRHVLADPVVFAIEESPQWWGHRPMVGP